LSKFRPTYLVALRTGPRWSWLLRLHVQPDYRAAGDWAVPGWDRSPHLRPLRRDSQLRPHLQRVKRRRYHSASGRSLVRDYHPSHSDERVVHRTVGLSSDAVGQDL